MDDVMDHPHYLQHVAASMMKPVEERIRNQLATKHPDYGHPRHFVEAVQRQHELYVNEISAALSGRDEGLVKRARVEALLGSYERTLSDFARLVDLRASSDTSMATTPRRSWQYSVGRTSHVLRLAGFLAAKLSFTSVTSSPTARPRPLKPAVRSEPRESAEGGCEPEEE